MSVHSRSNWNLKLLVYEERGKPEYPEKNLSEHRREPATNSEGYVRKYRIHKYRATSHPLISCPMQWKTTEFSTFARQAFWKRSNLKVFNDWNQVKNSKAIRNLSREKSSGSLTLSQHGRSLSLISLSVITPSPREWQSLLYESKKLFPSLTLNERFLSGGHSWYPWSWRRER